MVGIVAYLLFVAFIYSAEGESVFFWILAGMGILVAVFGFIALLIPDDKKEKEDRAMENWVNYWAAGGLGNGQRKPDDRVRLAPPPEGLQRNIDKKKDEIAAMIIGLSDD